VVLVGTKRPLRLLFLGISILPSTWWECNSPSCQSANNSRSRDRSMAYRNHILKFCLEDTVIDLSAQCYSGYRSVVVCAQGYDAKESYTCRNSHWHLLPRAHRNLSRWKKHQLCFSSVIAPQSRISNGKGGWIVGQGGATGMHTRWNSQTVRGPP